MPDPEVELQSRVKEKDAKATAETFQDATKPFEYDDKRKQEIVDMVLTDAHTSTESMKPYLSRIEDAIRSYEQERDIKTEPFQGSCFDENTEVLTENGWKNVSEILIGEQILSMNPVTLESSYQPVTNTYKYFYNDDMVRIKSNSADLLVTPNHNILIRDSYKDSKLKFQRADKLSVNHRIPLTSSWQGKSPEYTFGFCSSDFMSFLGWYISEGWSYKSGPIGIAQTITRNSKKVLEIGYLLKRMGLKYSYRIFPGQFIVSCKKIPIEMRNLLKSLGRSNEKFIPRFLLNYDKDCLISLLESLMDGDGCTHRDPKHPEYNPSLCYYTSSPKLADDVQELVQKIGMKAKISVRDRIGMLVGVKDGRVNQGYARFKSNEVSILHRKYSKTKSKFISRQAYRGFVYCPEVPPFNTVYVRRNGIAVWCGNSNISMGDIPIAVENMHPRLFGAIWNDNLSHIEANDPPSKENLTNIRSLMDWVYRIDMRDLYNKIDEDTHSTILTGTQVTWLRWDKVRHVDIGLEKTKNNVSVIKPKIFFRERAQYDNLNTEDFLIPITEGQDHHKFSYNIRRYYMTMVELKEFMLRRKIELSTDKKITNEQRLTTSIDEWIQKEHGEELQRLKTAGFSLPNIRQRFRIEVLDWHGLYDENDDGFREECWFMVLRNLKLYVDGSLQPSPDGLRPFEVTRMIPRKNFFYGIGIPEFIRFLAMERDAIHNQRLDASAVTMIPFGVYRSASGFKPEKMILQPGSMFPVDDINDLKLMNFTAPQTILAAEETQTQFQIEKLTVAGSAQLGRESEILKTRATARGTELMVGQGNIRFSNYGKRVAKAIARKLDRVTVFYQILMPPDTPMRVLGRKGEVVFPKGLTREQILGRYSNYISGDTDMANKSMERQVRTVIMQTLSAHPLVASNPSRLWEVLKDWLEAFDVKDIDRLIGSKPPDMQDFIREIEASIERVEQGFPLEVNKGNTIAHIAGLTSFMQTERFGELDSKKQALITDAIRNSRLFLMENISRQLQVQQAQQQAGGQPGQSGQGISGQGVQGNGQIPAGTGAGAVGAGQSKSRPTQSLSADRPLGEL